MSPEVSTEPTPPETIDAPAAPTADGAGEEYVFPTTVGQKRFWSLDGLQPGNPALNMPVSSRLAGRINRAAFQGALDEILRKHETLRCRFETEGDELVQVVCPPGPVEVIWIDCTTTPVAERPAKIEAVKMEHGSRSFDLRKGPFLRAAVATFAEDEHVMMLTMHHIASDGWSNGVLVTEFAQNYTRLVRGEQPPFDDLPLQYADYAVWQQEWLAGPEGQAQHKYWTDVLGTEIPLLNLPTDRPRGRKASTNGTINTLLLSQELSDKVRQVCQRENATPFMGYLAAYVMLLHRYTGRREFVIGSPAANRNQTELEGMIGLFANPILFRPKVSPDMTFRQLLHHVRDVSLGSFANQEYPFEILSENLRAEPTRRGVPWLQAYFLFQKAFMQPQKMPDLELTPLRSISPGAMFEWLLGLVERAEGVRFQLEYNTDLFDSATIDRALQHLLLIIKQAVTSLDFPIASFALNGAAPLAMAPALAAPTGSWLETVAAAFANNDASTLFEHGGQVLRLSDLRAYTARVQEAIAQVSRPGILRICVASNEPILAVAGAFAVAHCGHVAVLAAAPADVTLRGTLAAPSLDTTNPAPDGGAIEPGFVLRNDLANVADATITMSRDGVLSQAVAVATTLGLTAQDRVHSASGIDTLSGWEEILGAWSCGATACIRSGKAPATVTFVPAARVSEALRRDQTAELTAMQASRLVVLDRDPLSAAAISALVALPGSSRRVVQRLQPREIAATTALQELAGSGTNSIQAVPGWTSSIVDSHGNAVPVGIPGRWRVQSADATLTTGDWMRTRTDGSITWLGHTDDLDRTANFTLELYEIVTVACRHAAVWSAIAVTTTTPDGPAVVAHVVARPGASIGGEALKNFLVENLPSYVVPVAVIVHEQLPLDGAGRIDFATLREGRWLASVAAAAPAEAGGKAPRDEIETKLAALFTELLRLPEVDVRRSFFDLGGHSLLGVKLFGRIEKEFGQRLPLATLLGSPSVRGLATRIRKAQTGESGWSCLVPVQTEGDGPKFFCVHGAGGNILLYRDLARRMAPTFRFYGLQAQGLDGRSECLTRVEDMAELYLREILAEQTKGPYFLGGYCLGGNIAFEIGRLLQQRGETVGMVAMLDTYNLRKSLYKGTALDRFRIWMQKGGFHLDTLIHLSWAERKTYVAEKLRMARELFGSMFRRNPREADDASANLVAVVQHANHVALRAHDPQSFAGPLVLFKPRKNYHTFPDPKMGWGHLVSGKLEVVELPANPHAMLVEPFVQHLAARLSERMPTPTATGR